MDGTIDPSNDFETMKRGVTVEVTDVGIPKVSAGEGEGMVLILGGCCSCCWGGMGLLLSLLVLIPALPKSSKRKPQYLHDWAFWSLLVPHIGHFLDEAISFFYWPRRLGEVPLNLADAFDHILLTFKTPCAQTSNQRER